MTIANKIEVKESKDFGSYFGTVEAEKYDTGKDHFKPKYRSIYISSEMYPGTDRSFFYITSDIQGEMRLYRHQYWFNAEIGNIFASGKTLKETIAKFEHNFINKIYNKKDN